MNSKIWLVAQREFNTRVRKKSFIIMTVLSPILMAALIFVPLLLSMIKDSDTKTVAVIDNTGLYAPALEGNEYYRFVPTDKMSDNFKDKESDIFAVVQITGDLVDYPEAAAIYSQREVPNDLRRLVENALTEVVRNEKLKRYNIPELNSIVDDMQKKVEVTTLRWTEDGNAQESITEVYSIIGVILTMLIYMFVLTYGATVMQSVMDEKSNRIVELIVSSIRPIDLLLGKIIGIGFVGIFQMLIWAVLLSVFVTLGSLIIGVSLVGSTPEMMMATGSMSAVDPEILTGISLILNMPLLEIALLFIAYFIGGYLLYASFLAAFGSAINEPQDSQQFMMPVIIIILIAFYIGMYSAENPEGPLAFWSSFIPFTSSIVMMVRIPFGVPLYQELISLGLLYATAFFVLWISAKIYRVGIMMYGKKPSYADIIKWLKY